MMDLDAAWAEWRTAIEDTRAAIENTDRFREQPALRGPAYQSLLEAQAMAYSIAVAPRRQMAHARPFHHSTWHDNLFALGQPIQDFKYSGLFLDGQRTYTARGRIGDVRLWLTQVHTHVLGDPRAKEIGNYDWALDFDLGPGGEFEVTFSPDKHEGNWIRLDPDSRYNWLVMRRIFGDWSGDVGELVFDRSADVAPPDPDAEADSIAAAAHLLRYLVRVFTIGLHDLYIARAGGVNAWATMPGAEVADDLIGSRSTTYVPGVFRIAPDEALVIDWEPPRSAYWSVQLGDVWSRPLDYLHHQTDVNDARAVLDADGRFRAVISVADPGVPNWLDPCGNTEGTMVVRDYRAQNVTQRPNLTLVPRAELRSVLPADTPGITPDARRATLERRRLTASQFLLR